MAIPKPEQWPTNFSFARHLKHRLDRAPPAKKSHKTKALLQIAAVELLEQGGFHDLKVSGICARAGCAHGTFYRYWSDREAVTFEVLTEFMNFIRDARPRAQARLPLFERLVQGNLYYVEIYQANAGLMRCHMQLADQIPRFSKMATAVNLRLAERIVKAFEREGFAEAQSSRKADRTLTALAGIIMVDGLLRDIFLNGVELDQTSETLAHQVSLIWYRAFCGRDPAGALGPASGSDGPVQARRGKSDTTPQSRLGTLSRSSAARARRRGVS